MRPIPRPRDLSLAEVDGDDADIAALDVDEAPEGFSIETVEDGAGADEE